MDHLQQLIVEIESLRGDAADFVPDGGCAERVKRTPEAILESLRPFASDPRIAQCLTRLQSREPELRIHYMRTCMLHRLKEVCARRDNAAAESGVTRAGCVSGVEYHDE